MENDSNFVSQCADSPPSAFPLSTARSRILRRRQFSVASGPLTLPALFLQLKKFVQRINNSRRTTVSKCRVYLATNKASTRRYSRPRERYLSSPLFLFPFLLLSFFLFTGSWYLRSPLSLLARVAATLNDFATHYEKNVPHIRRDKSSFAPRFFLRPCASTSRPFVRII